jgi:hypothetical protein
VVGHLITDRETGRSGFGRMENEADAQKAISMLNDAARQPVAINIARPRKSARRRCGGGLAAAGGQAALGSRVRW